MLLPFIDDIVASVARGKGGKGGNPSQGGDNSKSMLLRADEPDASTTLTKNNHDDDIDTYLLHDTAEWS